MKKRNVLGILGGLGPMATVYFYEMLTSHTMADRDQDHLDIIITSRASTPDRTAFITGTSGENPLPVMIEEAQRLERAGAGIIVMPCNTAHYFYDEIKKSISVPMLDIIGETVAFCSREGFGRIGLMATEGTVMTGSYEKRAEQFGIEIVRPSYCSQSLVNEIIYGEIKRGLPADMTKFSSVADELRGKGCETVVLGCTELSLVKKQEHLGSYYTDSLEALAAAAIRACGKECKNDT